MLTASLLAAAAAAAAPAAAPAPADRFDPIVFELVKGSGIDFVTNSGRSAHRHQPETMVAGIALFDYDDDGRLDVFLTNGARMPELDKSEPVYWNRLYHNLGDWKFEDVTEKAGLKGRGLDLGVATGDFDDDGFADLFVAGLRENILYRNRGDGTFEDVSAKAGLRRSDPDYGALWSVAAAFFDYDKDGDLDLFVSNYVVWDPKTEPLCGPQGIHVERGLRELELAAQLEPGIAEIHWALANAYARAGRDTDAAREREAVRTLEARRSGREAPAPP